MRLAESNISTEHLLIAALGLGFLGFALATYLAFLVRPFLTACLPAGMERTEKISLLSTVSLWGFLASVIFHYVNAQFNGVTFPFDTFLPAPVTRFGDFYSVHDLWAREHFNGVGYGLSYFPCTYLFADLVTRYSGTPQSAVAKLLAAFVIYFGAYTFLNLRTKSVGTTLTAVALCFASYPFLFTYQTANFEWIVFLALSLFVFFYQRGRYQVSSFFLAIAVAMKFLPAVFLLLPFLDKKYRMIFSTVIWIIVLSVVPLYLFPGGFDTGLSTYLDHLHASQKMYFDLMVQSGAGIHFGHSLFGAIIVLAHGRLGSIPSALSPYFVFTMFLFAGLGLYIWKVERIFWRKVALIVLALDLLPYTSTDYKLLHLFIPIFLFINEREKDSYDALYILLFGVLLIPKDYFIFLRDPLLRADIVINPAVMVYMATLIIGSGFAARARRQVVQSAAVSP